MCARADGAPATGGGGDKCAGTGGGFGGGTSRKWGKVSTWYRMLPWESVAALGAAVVPDVNTSVAMLSRLTVALGRHSPAAMLAPPRSNTCTLAAQLAACG